MSSGFGETILILEDDLGVAKLQQKILERAGYRVQAMAAPREARARIEQGGIDLLLLDNRLANGVDGLTFYRELKNDGADLPVIMVTGFSDDATVISALREGVRDYVTKSVEYLNYLPEAVRRVLEQERTRQRLAESQARLSAVIHSALDAIIALDERRHITLFNPAAERVFNCPAFFAVGSPITKFLPEGLPPDRIMDDEAGELVGVLATCWEVRGLRADGSEVPLEMSMAREEPGGHRLFTLILRDITERKRTENALQEREERYRGLVEVCPDAIFVNRADRIAYVNSAFEKLIGAPEEQIVGRSVFDFLHPDDHPKACARIAHMRNTGEAVPLVEERLFRADGTMVYVECAAAPFTEAGVPVIQVVMRDITERKRAETALHESHRQLERALASLQAKSEELHATTQQLWQAAKLASVGELAAGIAHELNNPLGIISLRLESVLAQTPPGDPRRRPLEIVEQEVERMTGLIANVLQFSRRGKEEVSTVDVCDEIQRALELTHHHLKKRNVVVQPQFAADVPLIHADRQKLRQVFLNLFTNAGDAMPHGGTLAPRVYRHQGANQAIVIEVADTGVGIHAEHLPKVMDPFFTTKEEGKGTGLGLAICRRIIHEHSGTIHIESNPGQGTTIRIVLPVTNTTNPRQLK